MISVLGNIWGVEGSLDVRSCPTDFDKYSEKKKTKQKNKIKQTDFDRYSEKKKN